MLDKRKVLAPFVIIYLACFSGTATAQRVNTDPSSVLVQVGESVSLLCSFGTPILFCRINLPGSDQSLILAPGTVTPEVSYYGAGFEAGQCGVTISRVELRHNGNMTCGLGVAGQTVEQTGVISVMVASAPNAPEIVRESDRDSYGDDDIFVATCVSRGGRPPANLTWLLDNEVLYEGVQPDYVDNVDVNQNVQEITALRLQRRLSADDDGRVLTCRSEHVAIPAGFQDTRFRFSVKHRPIALPETNLYGFTLGSTALINITIRANPRPRVQWIIDGQMYEEGTQREKYSVYQVEDLGSGFYNATLSIAALTFEDTTKLYNLKASNDFGIQDYVVRISSSESQPLDSGFGIGAIIGIVLAVIFVLVVVILLGVARATGRWCFAGDKNNTKPNNETNDTDSSSNEDGRTPTSFVKKYNLKNFFPFNKPPSKTEELQEMQTSAATTAAEKHEKYVVSEENVEKGSPDQDEKKLVYAELMLKPASGGGGVVATEDEKTKQPSKESTEYAEILYVAKDAVSKDSKKANAERPI